MGRKGKTKEKDDGDVEEEATVDSLSAIKAKPFGANKAKANYQSKLDCLFCGEVGHIARNCPESGAASGCVKNVSARIKSKKKVADKVDEFFVEADTVGSEEDEDELRGDSLAAADGKSRVFIIDGDACEPRMENVGSAVFTGNSFETAARKVWRQHKVLERVALIEQDSGETKVLDLRKWRVRKKYAAQHGKPQDH